MCMDICHNIFSMSNFQIALLFAPLTLDQRPWLLVFG